MTMPRVSTRIRSVDVLRGLACVLMAIDHVRVYSGLPAGGPTAGIFFTRWITHFVAPAYCFFAGTSAFLVGRKLDDVRALGRYLIRRGIVLVLLELTLLRFAWTFNFDYAHYVLAGVIWMLGICLILLAGLVRFSPRTVGVVGLVVIFAQQLVALFAKAIPETLFVHVRWLFQFLYFGGTFAVGEGGPVVAVLYSIVPWIGVMACGYAFGAIVICDQAERRRLCLRMGLSATAVFLLVGGLGVATSPASLEAPPALFRLLAQQKYPASQLFLLMTLGPIIALVPWAEQTRGWVADSLAMFGRVPLFYYLLHIPLIHVAAMIVSLVREGRVDPWLFGNHPMMPPPQPAGYTWSLGLLYLVFALVMPVLYLACRQYEVRRRTSHSPLDA